MMPIQFITKKRLCEHNCLMSSIAYQNSNKMESGFPQTSGQLPPTSGSFD